MHHIKKVLDLMQANLCVSGCNNRYLNEVVFSYLLIAQLLAMRAGGRYEKRAQELSIASLENISMFMVMSILGEHRYILGATWNATSNEILIVRKWYLEMAEQLQNLISEGVYE